MKKYIKNKYLGPRSDHLPERERERDDRLDCNQQQQQQQQDLKTFWTQTRLCFITHLVVRRTPGLATKNNKNNKQQEGVISMTSDQTWKRVNWKLGQNTTFTNHQTHAHIQVLWLHTRVLLFVFTKELSYATPWNPNPIPQLGIRINFLCFFF